MTKEDAAAFKERWRLVNERELEELKAATMEENLRQLAALMASVKPMGLADALKEEEQEVRERWMKLKSFYGV